MANKSKNKFASANTAKAEAPITATAEKTDTTPATQALDEIKPAAEKKPAVKKAAAVKKTAAEKTVEDDVAPAKKSGERYSKLYVEYLGKQLDGNEIIEMCKSDYRANNPKKQIRTIDVYVKPEENKAYYVINGKANGLFIDL